MTEIETARTRRLRLRATKKSKPKTSIEQFFCSAYGHQPESLGQPWNDPNPWRCTRCGAGFNLIKGWK